MFKQYAMYKGKYFVEILNDDSAKGYNIKVVRKTVYRGELVDGSGGFPRWVHITEIEKLDPAVVDIMVATNAI